MKNLSKFEENGIRKQDEAYKEKWAKKTFAISCSLCCSRNLRRGTCASCPIKEAHIRAMTEIAKGERETPVKQGQDPRVSITRTKVNGDIYITQVIHYGNNG